MKKYEFTGETKIIAGRTLHRIRALISFDDVAEGDLGGFIEKEENLSHDGDAWVYGNARVYGDARVYDNAEVCGDARVCGNADYISIKGLGSVNRTTTICKDKILGISVKCGCFFGSLKDFEEKVKEIHGNNKYAQEYKLLIELAKVHFDNGSEEYV